MKYNITIKSRISFYRNVWICIVITILFSFGTIDWIAITIRRYIFIFIHLLLDRHLARSTSSARRIDIAKPTFTFITRKKEYILAFKGFHIVKHLPKPSIY